MRAAAIVHKCIGSHKSMLGGDEYPDEHDCSCSLARDHTVEEYLERITSHD